MPLAVRSADSAPDGSLVVIIVVVVSSRLLSAA